MAHGSCVGVGVPEGVGDCVCVVVRVCDRDVVGDGDLVCEAVCDCDAVRVLVWDGDCVRVREAVVVIVGVAVGVGDRDSELLDEPLGVAACEALLDGLTVTDAVWEGDGAWLGLCVCDPDRESVCESDGEDVRLGETVPVRDGLDERVRVSVGVRVSDWLELPVPVFVWLVVHDCEREALGVAVAVDEPLVDGVAVNELVGRALAEPVGVTVGAWLDVVDCVGDCDAVGVPEAVMVWVCEAVSVGTGVKVAETDGLRVCDGSWLGVGVRLGVSVAVGDKLGVAVEEGVDEPVPLRVCVCDRDWVSLGLGDADGVDAPERVSVALGVCVVDGDWVGVGPIDGLLVEDRVRVWLGLSLPEELGVPVSLALALCAGVALPDRETLCDGLCVRVSDVDSLWLWVLVSLGVGKELAVADPDGVDDAERVWDAVFDVVCDGDSAQRDLTATSSIARKAGESESSVEAHTPARRRTVDSGVPVPSRGT